MRGFILMALSMVMLGTVATSRVLGDPNSPALLTVQETELGNVFIAGEPVSIKVVNTSADTVRWKITDFWGKNVGDGSTAVVGNSAVVQPQLDGRRGYFSVDISAEKGGTVLARAQSSLAILSPFTTPDGAQSPFGVMTHFAQGWPIDVIPLVAKAGVANVRDEIYWDAVESTKGAYAFPESYEAYMAGLKANGISPLVPMTFANHSYDDGHTPYTQDGFDAYARYCVQVLRHYGSQIKTVEIWNEYNGSFANGPATNDRPDTYVGMLKTAYTAIKEARPDVTVLGCSTAGTPLPYLERIFKAGGLKYMDAISIHPYRYDDAPEGMEKQVELLQDLVKKYNNGKPKPIWVSEIGWFVKTKLALGEMPITESDQAKFVVRSDALLFSSGVSRVYWYLFRDYGSFATMGLVRAPNDPQGRYAIKPSYVALATMTRQLAGATYVRDEPTLAGTYSILFKKADGENIRVIWCGTGPSALRVRTDRPLAIFDMMGQQTTLRPNHGMVALSVSDAPIYVHGEIVSLPPPDRSAERAIVANSESGFSGTQGQNNWWYGTFQSGAVPGDYDPSAFVPFLNYVAADWDYQWSGAQQFLSITAGGQHPGVAGGRQIWAVRRWISPDEKRVEVSGKFARGSNQGDGTGALIFVDGKPMFSALLGGGQSIRADFDFKAVLHAGSTVDFAVDPGPGTNLDFDGASLSATIKQAGTN